jgi:hypothetical protein
MRQPGWHLRAEEVAKSLCYWYPVMKFIYGAKGFSMRHSSEKREKAMQEIVVEPGIYQHYRGGRYQVIGEALFSENPHEKFVLYKSLREVRLREEGTVLPVGTMWVRPKEMFVESLEFEGKTVKRFQKIS